MQLQKAAQGLLGWFNLKTTGRNPPTFGDTVTPVVDIGDSYLVQGELDISQATAIATGATTSGNSTLTVPNGKFWRVLAVALQVTPNGADIGIAQDVSVRVLPPAGAGTPCVIASAVFPVAAAGAGLNSHLWGLYLPRPLLLPSGWALLYQINLDRAASINVAGSCFALRQQIDA